MKKIIQHTFFLVSLSFAVLTASLVSSSQAWAESSPGAVPYHSTYAVEGVENRVRNYLGNYLLPSEYSVVVRAKPIDRQRDPASQPSQAYLPGAPGWGQDTQANETRSYYDEGGNFHGNIDDRPPISVDVIIDSSVEAAKVQLFKKVIPKLAAVNGSKGDDISITTGHLERTAPKEPPKPQEPSFIDSLMKYKKELTALGLGLLAALAALILVHGVMTILANKAKGEEKLKDPPHRPFPPDEPKEDLKPKSKGRLGSDNDRQNPYSRDASLTKLLAEVIDEAKSNPNKLARLISQWLQENKVQQSGALLNNFDMPTSEKIAEFLTPAEMDRMRPFMTGQTDPYSEENANVANDARQDLIRISAKIKNESDNQRFAFLNRVDDEMLRELMKGESPKVFAMVSTLVSANRVAVHLKSLSPDEVKEFFDALCNVSSLAPQEWDELAAALKAKMDRWHGAMVTDASKSRVILNLIHQLNDSDSQRKVLEQLELTSPAIGKKLRDSVYFFEDVIGLSESLLKVVFSQVDASDLSVALKGLDEVTVARLMGSMSKTTKEIVAFDLNSSRVFAPGSVMQAREQLVNVLQICILTGVVNPHDVRAVVDRRAAA